MRSSKRWTALATICCAVLGSAGLWGESMMIIDFAAGAEIWPSIDDVVMGGVSASRMTLEEGYASFQGAVSFDNNGGFASVRSRPKVRDLSAFDGLILRVRGDGKSYGFRIRTSASFDGVSYQASLAPPAGEWTDVFIPFSDFAPVWRGRTVPDHPPLDPARVTTMGVIVSRQEGPSSSTSRISEAIGKRMMMELPRDSVDDKPGQPEETSRAPSGRPCTRTTARNTSSCLIGFEMMREADRRVEIEAVLTGRPSRDALAGAGGPRAWRIGWR